jgi:hypothetical protein
MLLLILLPRALSWPTGRETGGQVPYMDKLLNVDLNLIC